MADGKWIRGLTPGLAAAEAAQLILDVRLGAVADALPAVIVQPEAAEVVHQLRVAARRAAAAIRAVRPWLRRKSYRRLRDTLRELRQAAGAARDWDVFRVALADTPALAGEDHLPARMLLTGYALGERQAATPGLLGTAYEHQDAVVKWAENPARLLNRRAGADDTTAQEVADGFISPLLADFDALVAVEPKSAEEFHALRIAAKRVRYAMELFAELTPPSYLDDLYPVVVALQEVLGRAQDAAVGAARLGAIRQAVPRDLAEEYDDIRSALGAYDASLADAGEAARAEFPAWRECWRTLRTAPTGDASA